MCRDDKELVKALWEVEMFPTKKVWKEVAIEALKKRIASVPVPTGRSNMFKCPDCGKLITRESSPYGCKFCLQAFDWTPITGEMKTPEPWNYKYRVLYHSERGFGTAEVFRNDPIESFENSYEIAEMISKAMSLRQVVIMQIAEVTEDEP